MGKHWKEDAYVKTYETKQLSWLKRRVYGRGSVQLVDLGAQPVEGLYQMFKERLLEEVDVMLVTQEHGPQNVYLVDAEKKNPPSTGD